MHRAEPIRVPHEFRSNSQQNHAIANSVANSPNSPLCVFNNLRTPRSLNFELSPVFPCDYAFPTKKGGVGYPPDTAVPTPRRQALYFQGFVQYPSPQAFYSQSFEQF